MNIILLDCYEINPNYCHFKYIDSVEDLMSVLDTLCKELEPNYKFPDILEFCKTLHFYCLNEDNNNEVYNFDVEYYLNNI